MKKKKRRRNRHCQEGFRYDEVNSCVKHPLKKRINGDDAPYERSALYELRNDGSGLPYGSVLDLRRDKIRNFLGVAGYHFVSGIVPVRYEELLRDGADFLIQRVESLTGVEAKCHPSPPKAYKRPRRMESDFVDWMTKYVDWNVEALIGYENGVFPGNMHQPEFVDSSN